MLHEGLFERSRRRASSAFGALGLNRAFGALGLTVLIAVVSTASSASAFAQDARLPTSRFEWSGRAYLSAPADARAPISSNRVFLAFTRQDVRALRSSIGRPAFEKDLDALRASGVRPWLLIGEPNFHDPAYLADLYWLLDSARAGLFEGVALNVERQSGVTLDVWSDRFLAVLKHLSGSPNRKLAIVVHHDDAIALERRGAFALLDEVILMAFTTAPGAAKWVGQSFMVRNPNTRFSLAQSLETGLPPENSWLTHEGNEASARQAMIQALSGLEAHHNFVEIVVQP